MDSNFSNIGGHFGNDEQIYGSYRWDETNASAHTVQNVAGFAGSPTNAVHQYPPPPLPHATLGLPYPLPNVDMHENTPQTWAAVVRRGMQEPSIPPTFTVPMDPTQNNLQRQIPTPPRTEFDARQANDYQNRARSMRRTYAQVLQDQWTAQSGSIPLQQQPMSADPGVDILQSAPSGIVGQTSHNNPSLDFIGSEVLYNPNFQWRVTDSSNDIGEWLQPPRATGDRTRPQQSPRSPDQRANHAPARPPSITSPSSISRSSTRRTREQMTAGEHEHTCTCGAGFDTLHELNHHSRCHLPYDDRAHQCSVCGTKFTYAKDLRRHQPIHGPQRFFCTHRFCKSATTGFKRYDHLQRHMRSQHPDSVMQSSGPSSQRGF